MTAYIITGALLICGGVLTLLIFTRRREDERFNLWMRDFEFSLGYTVPYCDEITVCRDLFDSGADFKTAKEEYLSIQESKRIIKETEKLFPKHKLNGKH